MLSPGLANMIIPPPALSSLSLLTSTPSSLGFRKIASADFACTTEELLLASDAALAQVLAGIERLLLLRLLHLINLLLSTPSFAIYSVLRSCKKRTSL